MATAAERQRRSRRHKAGDHSLCDPTRCDDAQATVTPVTVLGEQPAAERVPGEIEQETADFVDALKFAEGDPRAVMARIAVKLARKVDDSGATAAAIGQLRVLLWQLAEIPDQPAGPVDGVRARRAARRLTGMLGRAS